MRLSFERKFSHVALKSIFQVIAIYMYVRRMVDIMYDERSIAYTYIPSADTNEWMADVWAKGYMYR